MKTVQIKVDKELLSKTEMMNAYQRRNYLTAAGALPAHHVHGYGIYSGVFMMDDETVSYRIGDSCD